MNRRGKVVIASVLAIAALAAFTLAHAATKMPEQDLVINTTDVFKEKKKAPVNFSHPKHKALKCIDCHHEYKDGKNVWQEGQEVKKCGACHKFEAQDKIVKLEKAYHDQCINCHKKFKAEKKTTGPTACAKCHPPKPGEKPEKE
ncbi:MAG: cytochrome c3 family protein [Desulfomonile tiedjei]|uniref:Cytochrome c3 family protein n=1 Tax=Desulfomonile tiedjei TaxID=2358 RepID=A0A9D6Z1Z2_9BACT|nr:cytochrome c3 family protein [Desulfomonile tiedjei]